jgi:hypothetical protein
MNKLAILGMEHLAEAEAAQALPPPCSLTKRELFAAMVMQGFAADTNEGAQPAVIASYAVRYADALLAELAKEPQS